MKFRFCLHDQPAHIMATCEGIAARGFSAAIATLTRLCPEPTQMSHWVIFDRGTGLCPRHISASPRKLTSGPNEKLAAIGQQSTKDRENFNAIVYSVSPAICWSNQARSRFQPALSGESFTRRSMIAFSSRSAAKAFSQSFEGFLPIL